LKGVEKEQRTARFKCSIALAGPQHLFLVAEGSCEGIIIEKPAGKHGFGYDPIFYVPDYNRTFAELSPEIKNEISHRGKALKLFKDRVIPLIQSF
jgi:XTP/dITP diphosphohydrolase